MKFALSLIALVVLALIVPFFIPGPGQQEGVDPNSNLPWQITVKVADADSVRLSATHRCHWVYANDTLLANIPLREH